MMRWILAAVAMCVLGCEYNVPVALHGDVTFTANERDAIEQGNAWIADRVGRSAYPIVWDLPHPSDANDATKLSIVRGLSPAHFALGVGFESGDRHIEIDPSNAGENEVAIVAAHEVGHMFGLGHHDGPGIMNPTGNGEIAGSLVWTTEDQAACVRDGGCDHVASPM